MALIIVNSRVNPRPLSIEYTFVLYYYCRRVTSDWDFFGNVDVSQHVRFQRRVCGERAHISQVKRSLRSIVETNDVSAQRPLGIAYPVL